MVWFTFAFLLGLPQNNEGNTEEKSKKKEGKLQVEKNYTETEVSKPNFTCHIEYVLFPNQGPKFVDVLCWEDAAKIYFEDTSSAIRPLVIGRLRWIHFRVNHKVVLKTKDVPVFHGHNIKFTVTLDTKKLGEAAKSDKPKKFYGLKFPEDKEEYFVQKQYFQPLSETLEDLKPVSFLKEHLTPHQQLYISLDSTIETSEHYGKLYEVLADLTKEYHDENFPRVPTPPYQEFPSLRRLSKLELGEAGLNGPKGKDRKNDPKKKDPLREKMEFAITGEDFLSGRKTIENCLKYNSEELPYIFSLGSVKNLLSRAQAEFLNPLSIMINNFNYLPADELVNCGITKLKFQYLICNEFVAESNLFPITDRIKINFTRTVLTNTVDKPQLIHFIKTSGLKIDVLGILTKKNTCLEKNIYPGQGMVTRKNDYLKSDNYLEMGKNTDLIPLGTISADISSILLQPHKLLLKCNFQYSPDYAFICKKEDGSNFIAINDFNFSCRRRKVQNFNYYSGSSHPVVTILVGLSHPLTNIQQTVAMNPNLFNRLFAVLYSIKIAKQIIKVIQDEISEFLEPIDLIKNGVNVRRPLTHKNFPISHNFDCAKKIRMTGFLMDCSDKILIYVESSMFEKIQNIWAIVSSIIPTQGHVLYDSSLIFCDRLYENFSKFGGFFTLALEEAPENMLCKPENYCKKNIPEPAWKALKSLDLLVNCKSIKTAAQNNLFPNPDSLRSLAKEFGVPVKIREKIERSR